MNEQDRMIEAQALVISKQNEFIRRMSAKRELLEKTVLETARKAKFYDLLVSAIQETPSMQSDWDSICIALKLAHPEAADWPSLSQKLEQQLLNDIYEAYR